MRGQNNIYGDTLYMIRFPTQDPSNIYGAVPDFKSI